MFCFVWFSYDTLTICWIKTIQVSTNTILSELLFSIQLHHSFLIYAEFALSYSWYLLCSLWLRVFVLFWYAFLSGNNFLCGCPPFHLFHSPTLILEISFIKKVISGIILTDRKKNLSDSFNSPQFLTNYWSL